MSMRYKPNQARSRRTFARTANTTNSKNIFPSVMRGGIRL